MSIQKQKQKPTTPSDKLSLVKEILNKGDREEVRALFEFDSNNSKEEVLLKFRLWSRWFFPDYFIDKQTSNALQDAPFHIRIDEENLRVYRGEVSHFINIGFRGCAKTSRTKLFVAFVIANDNDHRRRFVKIVSSDSANSRQIVTDVFNMFVSPRVAFYYPEILQKTEQKREEKMSTFTTAAGVKMSSGTVGMEQRGDLQEDSRPDFLWMEDFESRKTLRSAVLTQAIWDNMEEARTGLSIDGGVVYTCNYLSERGNVHKLVDTRDNVLITPILTDNEPTWKIYTKERIAQIKRDSDDFEGEYMCEPSAGADVFFDRSVLEKQEVKQPIKELAGFKIFHAYNPSHRYGSGHDVGGGVGLDHSTSVFIDFSVIPARVVATFKSNTIKPDTFGDEIAREAEMYGEPIVAPESNNHGHATIGRLKQIYENIYVSNSDLVAINDQNAKDYGWHTNTATKPHMFFDLLKAITDGHLDLSDEDIINEARSYSRDDLMDKDVDPRLTTRHFDFLVATAIAWQMRYHAQPAKKRNSDFDTSFDMSQLDVY